MIKSLFVIVVISLLMVLSCGKENSQNPKSVLDNRDGVASDLFNLGARAQLYYRQEGAGSFVGFKISTNFIETNNGKYSLENVLAQSISIVGVGKLKGNDNINPIKIVIKILPDRIEPVNEIN